LQFLVWAGLGQEIIFRVKPVSAPGLLFPRAIHWRRLSCWQATEVRRIICWSDRWQFLLVDVREITHVRNSRYHANTGWTNVHTKTRVFSGFASIIWESCPLW